LAVRKYKSIGLNSDQLKEAGLVNTSEVSSRAINIRKSPSIHKTISKKELKNHIDDGWELLPNKLKASERVRKDKPHNLAFEDRVWGLFAKMGFTYLNASNHFLLSYGNGLNKQIDVIACDEEVVIVVECKSSAERTRGRYQTSIHEFALLKEPLRNTIRKLMPGSPKVAFVFATNNSIVSDKDKQRLNENSIHHFSQDHINYYEQLADHLGAAAKFQLFGSLFAGETIPNLRTRVPAIKGKVASGQTFYSFSIDPHTLLKLSYVLHRNDIDQESSNAYQRLVKKSRLDQSLLQKSSHLLN